MDNKIYDFLHPDARWLRKTVFMEEQGFKNEFDDIDDKAYHVVYYSQEQPVATCRFYEKDGVYHIGRICVLSEYRGAHIGTKVLKIAEEAIKKHASYVTLSAQVRVKGFYESQGYIATGEPYDDEGVPHIQMVKSL